MAASLEVKKCGVKFDPPALVITYIERKTGKLRRRTMPLRNFSKDSGVERCSEELNKHPRHAKYIRCLPQVQLLKMLTIIKDRMNGMSLEASIAKNEQMDRLDPNEDLNKVDEETLKRKKLQMDEKFEKNRKVPGDPEFRYNIEVDFEVEDHGVESSGWDSECSDPEF